jgi:serine/threonine-protein kinase
MRKASEIAEGDRLLDKYVVERVLGRGGMGLVLAVRHEELGGLFAMKLLLPQALGFPEALPRFLREARAAAKLRSEHAVRVVDVGKLPSGEPYMLMEHLDGSDLKDVLEREGPLVPRRAVRYVLEVCEALDEAHAHGVVHRDLKPANIFLVRRPNGASTVKVIDFGISKDTSAGELDLTTSNAVMGSPLYMSPEQMTRSKSVDGRTDLWSLGVVLYELLTGAVPFEAEAITELVAKVIQAEPVPPTRHAPHLAPELEALVLRCLAKKPDERWASARALADALRALPLSDDATAGSAEGVPPARTSSSVGSSPQPTRSAMALDETSLAPPQVSAGEAGALAGATTTSAATPASTSAEPRARRPVAAWAWVAAGVGVLAVALVRGGAAGTDVVTAAATSAGSETKPDLGIGWRQPNREAGSATTPVSALPSSEAAGASAPVSSAAASAAPPVASTADRPPPPRSAPPPGAQTAKTSGTGASVPTSTPKATAAPRPTATAAAGGHETMY